MLSERDRVPARRARSLAFRHEAVKAATAGRSGSGMEPARCRFIPDRPAGHINGPSYRLKNRLAAVEALLHKAAT